MDTKQITRDELIALLGDRLTLVMEKDYGYYGDCDVMATVLLDGVAIMDDSRGIPGRESYTSCNCSCGDCDP